MRPDQRDDAARELAEAAVATNAALLDDAAADVGGYPAEPGDAAAELVRERPVRGE